jgi:hypothetical protein
MGSSIDITLIRSRQTAIKKQISYLIDQYLAKNPPLVKYRIKSHLLKIFEGGGSSVIFYAIFNQMVAMNSPLIDYSKNKKDGFIVVTHEFYEKIKKELAQNELAKTVH